MSTEIGGPISVARVMKVVKGPAGTAGPPKAGPQRQVEEVKDRGGTEIGGPISVARRRVDDMRAGAWLFVTMGAWHACWTAELGWLWDWW